MRVLKRNPKTLSQWKTIRKCGHCKAILEVTELDVFKSGTRAWVARLNRWESTWTKAWFECEDCSSTNFLQPTDIPEEVLQRVRGAFSKPRGVSVDSESVDPVELTVPF